MRELKECTAEVFRRSEKRIKDRKRTRNRVLVLCIPLCLAVTAASAWFFPTMRTHDDAYGSAWDAAVNTGETETLGETLESIAFAYTSVELRTVDSLPEHTEKVTDQAVIADLFDTMQSLFADGNGDGQTTGEGWLTEGAENQDQNQADASSQRKAYTITFITKEGVQTVYQLNGNTLSRGDMDEAILLNNAQVTELLRIFGISQ